MPTPNTPGGGPASPSPVLPGSPAGGPSGPGGTPVVSPGPGAGNQALASSRIQAMLPLIRMAMMAFPIGSKEEKAVARALSSLTAVFSKPNDEALTSGAIVDMQQAARSRSPMASAPPPGIQPASPGAPGGTPPTPEIPNA